MRDQSKRVVLITGGSSGLGFEMAKQMILQHSTVIICGKSQEKLDNAKKIIPQLVTIKCDITNSKECEAMYEKIIDRFKNLNMLINNAGIVRRFLFAKTNNLEKNIIEEWKTNYFAPVMLTKQFLPILIKNNGTVVNVSSGLAYIPLSVEPNYCATKAALHSMTQSMRIQLSKHGVKVIEIFYPAVDTPFQGGHAPNHAIKPDLAAAIALKGINHEKKEIRVKMAALIFIMSRLMPSRALNMINGFIPENVEEILTDK